MSMPTAIPVLISVALLAGGALAGCSSEEDVARNAALSDSTQLCVINDSPARAELTYLEVDKGKTSGETILWENSGDKGCGTGSGAVVASEVAIGVETFDPDAKWILKAGNAVVGAPGMYVRQQVSGKLYDCINDSFEVNDSLSYDDGFMKITTKRLADTDVKNFEVRLSASTDPSTTGTARMCKKVLTLSGD